MRGYLGYFLWGNIANFMTGDAPTPLAHPWYLAVPPTHPSPPPWFLQDGNEVGLAPSSKATAMLETRHPTRVCSETLFPLPGSMPRGAELILGGKGDAPTLPDKEPVARHRPLCVPQSAAQDPRGIGEHLAKPAWHKPWCQQTGTTRGLGVKLGCQKHCGHVARSQPHLQASEGIPPLPGRAPHITELPPLLQACGWSRELPAGHISWGILWQAPFPNASFQHRCSPPPPVALENWFPAGSSDRLPKDGSSKPGMAGEEREGCNTLSILPSAEYCLGKTMRLFFKRNLQEILAFPAASAVPACPGEPCPAAPA